MKKFYKCYQKIFFNNEFITIDYNSKWYYLEENETELVTTKINTWEKAKEFAIKDEYNIYTAFGKTFFKKKEYVKIRKSDWWSDGYYQLFEEDFPNDLYIIHTDYVEVDLNYYTLKEIMDRTKASDFIEYLKDNGLTTCPMINI